MRRGLIARSQVELPDAVFDARLDRLRAAMARRLDALLVYTNNTRPAGGVLADRLRALLVGGDAGAAARSAPPVLVVALTFRVKPWIERTSRVAEVDPYAAHRHRGGAPDRRRQGRCGGRRRRFRSPVRPASPTICARPARGSRSPTPASCSPRCAASADPAEIMLAARASAIASAALSCIDPCAHRHRRDPGGGRGRGAPARRRGGLCRGSARPRPRPTVHAHRQRASGEPTLGARFAVRASVAYKGSWVRRAVTDRPRRRGDAPRRRGCVRRGGGAAAGRPRAIAIRLLRGRGMPAVAAARSPDGIARRRTAAAGRRRRGVGAGLHRGRWPAGSARRAGSCGRARRGRERFCLRRRRCAAAASRIALTDS